LFYHQEALMSDASLLTAILDSLPEPILVADTDHIIRYMNRAAIAHYKGGETLLGQSLLDCHNPRSQEIILRVLEELRSGTEEQFIYENDRYRVYMRAVRSADGRLLGYYERYERRTSP
jgi:DUF438 domain-containing protein